MGGRGLPGVEVALEEFRGDLMGVQQSLPAPHFFALGPRALLVTQLVADAPGQPFHRFGERRVIHFHEERDHVTGFVAAEAVVSTHVRAHVEGRRALVVERAQALVGTNAGGLEGHVLVDDFLEVGA